MHSPRIPQAAVLVLVVSTLSGLVLFDAARRRKASSDEQAYDTVAITGIPDLALSSTSRWLRTPSQVEPWAAVADAPASLDTEPAGAVIGPPRP